MSGDRLAALVLVDTLGLTDFRPSPEFGAALNQFYSAPGEHSHDRLWSQCVLDLPAVRRQLGGQWELIKAYNLVSMQTPGRIGALAGLMEQFGVAAIPPAALAQITTPTTLIWGRHDRATPLSVAEEASARYRWRLQTIEGAADDPALEQPEAFLRALRQALEAW